MKPIKPGLKVWVHGVPGTVVKKDPRGSYWVVKINNQDMLVPEGIMLGPVEMQRRAKEAKKK